MELDSAELEVFGCGPDEGLVPVGAEERDAVELGVFGCVPDEGLVPLCAEERDAAELGVFGGGDLGIVEAAFDEVAELWELELTVSVLRGFPADFGSCRDGLLAGGVGGCHD